MTNRTLSLLLVTAAGATLGATTGGRGASQTNALGSGQAAQVQGTQAGVRGDPRAVAAALRMLDAAGGARMWSNRTLIVEERAYLRSGDTAIIRIARDFEANTRRIERMTSSERLLEWVAPTGGLVRRNGADETMSTPTLQAELHGLKQEPYAIYHRLARRDTTLRVELQEQHTRLVVYDAAERLLCWFLLDARGGVMGWGNVFDGRIHQHLYGPIADMGDANLPRWGVSIDGSFRFEYVSARFESAAIAPPSRP